MAATIIYGLAFGASARLMISLRTNMTLGTPPTPP
jgi:hypothetical protein